MADLTVFSNKNFNSTVWINNTIKEINNEESIESYITSLSTKLHIMSQDYTDQLETAMVESMSIMPRVLSEITKTEDQLRNIEIEMKNLSVQLNTFDERNVIGVEDLSRLDMLKSNMEKCKATLEEHARWSQLVREAKILLESGSKLSDSADCIEIMFHSLEILKNLPGNEERKETCETFRNSLLSALRPIVAKDIAGLDIGPLKEYLYVFEKLGRHTELEEQYVSARPNHIKLYWNDYHITEKSSVDFIKWLSLYFNKISKLIIDEELSTIALFGKDKSMNIMCKMICESLKPYTDGLQIRFIALKINSPLLIFQSYQLTDEFTKHLTSILKSIQNETLQLKLLDALYQGYHTDVNTYIKKEELYLSEKLRQLIDIIIFITPDTKSSMHGNSNHASLDEELFGDGSTSSESSSSDLIYINYCDKILMVCNTFHLIIEETLSRAIHFIGGISMKSIIRAISSHINSFVKQLILKIDDLMIACGINRGDNNNNFLDSDSTKLASSSNLSQYSQVQGDGITMHTQSLNAEKLGLKITSRRSDIDHKSLIITALKALQSIGRFLKQFQILENSTKQILLTLQQQVFNSISFVTALDNYDNNNSNSIGVIYAMHVLQINEDSLNELKSFLVSATSTTSHIISQSAYSNIYPMITKIKSITTSLLFNLCIETPEKVMSSYSSEDIWYTKVNSEYYSTNSSINIIDNDEDGKGIDSKALANSKSIEILEKLCENLLPQAVISQVGEYMLSLVQELESFASTDALTDLLKFKGESKLLACLSSGWQKVKNVLSISEADILIGLSNRMKCASIVATIETTLLGSSEIAMAIAQSGGTLYEDDDNMNDHDITSSSLAVDVNNDHINKENDVSNQVISFVNEWLGSIFDAIVGFLIAQIADISILTLSGSAQLLTDLEYLSNVCNAMGIRIHPLLSHIKLLLQQDPSKLLSSIESLFDTISETTSSTTTSKGSIAYLLKFDRLFIHSIAKGNNLLNK